MAGSNGNPPLLSGISATFREHCGADEFWDMELNLNSSAPRFSPCFLHTFPVWLPCIFLWIWTPLQVYFCFASEKLPLPWRPLNVLKLILSVLLTCNAMALFGYSMFEHREQGDGQPMVWFTYSLILAITLFNTVMLIYLCQRHGLHTSGVLTITWIMFAVFGIPEFYYWIRESLDSSDGATNDVTRFILYMIYYPLIWIQLIIHAFADKRGCYAAVGKEEKEKTCPETESSFMNQLVFWWFTELAILGWKRPLKTKDLWTLNDNDRSTHLVPKFEAEYTPVMMKYWKKKASIEDTAARIECKTVDEEVKIVTPGNGPASPGGQGRFSLRRGQKGPKVPQPPSIIWALFKVFYKTIVPCVIMKLLYDCSQFLNPMILKLLIGFVQDTAKPVWMGIFYVMLLFCNAQVGSLLLHQYFHRMFRTGMNVRTILVSAVYTKSLRTSNASRKTTTVGEVVNLMSVDAQRFQDTTGYVNMLWSAPLQIALAMFFLWQVLGPSVLAGVGVMILLIPINFFISMKLRKYQVAQMKYKDDRIKLMSEVLNGIKVLKLYAWEPSFEKMIKDIREKELNVLKKSAFLNAGASFTWMCAPFLVAVFTFTTYVLVDPEKNILTPETAFVSLSLFNILKFPMSMLPMLISFVVQTGVSNKRLKAYLSSEELDPDIVQKNPKHQREAIVLEHCQFAWERVPQTADHEQANQVATLKNIDLVIPQGELVAVVGQVGCGKSSLLSAILGEMEKLEGRVGLKGSVAYVPQQAWIQNMSLKENITFGRDFEPDFYEKVISACALKPDFDILPGGDSTEIGEKGINLSGGQKQRVSLARAVYHDTDIYLFDDPLSSVDSHVGRHIFENVMSSASGILKGKTRLLVTHGLTYLKHVDRIIVMLDGRISEIGTYKELLRNKGAFAEFLENYLVESAASALSADDSVLSGNDLVNLSGGDDPEEASEITEILGELEKVDPNCRKRFQKQVSVLSQSARSKRESERKSHTPPDLSTSRSSLNRSRQSLNSTPESPMEVYHTPVELSPLTDDGATAIDRDESENDDLVFNSSSGMQESWKDNGVRKRGGKDREEEKKEKELSPKKSENTKLIEDETSETGKVKWKIYIVYARAITLIMVIPFLLLYIVSSGFQVGSNVWLADWSDDADRRRKNETVVFDMKTRLAVYGVLGVGQSVMILFGALLMSLGMVVASRNLHGGILGTIMRLPMSFFDVTPTGRIVNRLGKDVDVVDNILPGTIRAFVMCVIGVVATVGVIVATTPLFAAVILPLAVMYYFILRFYVCTSRQLKRLESVTRSPIYSHFQETIQGASSIRAYGAVKAFGKESERRVDHNLVCYYPSVASNRWLAVRLEFIGICIVFFAALLAVLRRGDQMTAGLLGLSVTYALSVTQTLNWAVRMTSELETNIVAVERIQEYTEAKREADWESSDKASAPPKEWPEQGKVEFDQYTTRYREGLELVLKGISVQIQSGERVGIVGRTGAGKSSLTLALFRIVEAAGGRIVIDGRDISKMGLHELRGKLTIIPQDPVLFSGTLRMNLDPFEMYNDDELWTALEHAHLKTFVNSLAVGLEYAISEGGENLSVGQRQLLCLARALLRKTKVLILDEATAAVDLETDELIQKTIKTEFQECTILTIAHRLNTIMDYDRVLVLEKGLIKEFDSPGNLMTNKKTAFYLMAKDAGLIASG